MLMVEFLRISAICHVVLSYKVKKTVDAENRRKLIDAKLILTPHSFIASAVMNANIRQKEINKQLTES
jgi:hypothetical protein